MRDNKGRFIKGNISWVKIHGHSKEAIKKMSKTWFTKGHPYGKRFKKGERSSPNTEFKKGMVPWNKNKKLPQFSGDKSPTWKGNDVGYGGLHMWIKHILGQPKKCENCGTEKAKRFEWANKSRTYKRDFSDWIRLCKSCHLVFDEVPKKIWLKRKGVLYL
ncbi:MAG: hypothetical protein AABY22_35995 [Nanoarchaeota archaeon]